jgi:hypothetical protein
MSRFEQSEKATTHARRGRRAEILARDTEHLRRRMDEYERRRAALPGFADPVQRRAEQVALVVELGVIKETASAIGMAIAARAPDTAQPIQRR